VQWAMGLLQLQTLIEVLMRDGMCDVNHYRSDRTSSDLCDQTEFGVAVKLPIFGVYTFRSKSRVTIVAF
jgi:hypothetical protein